VEYRKFDELCLETEWSSEMYDELSQMQWSTAMFNVLCLRHNHHFVKSIYITYMYMSLELCLNSV